MLPHDDASGDELARRIAAAEGFYAGFGRAARFQVSPGACPVDLDATLVRRGYRRHSPLSLQTASTADVRAQARPGGPRMRLDDVPTTAWLDVWHAVHGQGGDPRVERDVLERVTPPTAYAAALEGGEVLAAGRAVADTSWAGVFGMATLPKARGRGAARSVLAALAEWASGRGADGMYLQVESDNDPALRLYAGTGFTEVCGYHYRTASA